MILDKRLLILPEYQIKKYQQIYKKQFGKETSREEAIKQGTALMKLAEIMLEKYLKNKRKTSKDRV